MPSSETGKAGSCACGASRFVVSGNPRARFICHCMICQSVYRKPYADVSAMWGGEVVVANEASVRFKHYRAPPALRRGTCSACGGPVVGFLRLAPFVRLAFVPSENFSDKSVLPRPAMHIFYHRRVADIADELPKYGGYWTSQLAVTRLLLKALFHEPPDA